jgi:hypothetical protein
MSPRFTTRSERFILAGVALTLVALKFRAAVAAGITVPAGLADWLHPNGWNAVLTVWNGQWDPFVIRLNNALVEAAAATAALAAIAVSCRGSGCSRWAMLTGGAIQIVIASLSPPVLVESWTQPWVVGLACTALLTLTRFRAYRLGALLLFIVLTGAAWTTGLFQPHPDEQGPAATPAAMSAGLTPEMRERLPMAVRSPLPLNTPVKSRFSYIAVSARRRPGSSGQNAAIYIEEVNGQKLAPLQGDLPNDGQWHRLNLPVPPGAFSIRTSGPIETGDAVEYAAGSRLAGKALRAWPLPALLAVIAFLGGALTLLAIPIERNVWRPHWSIREVRVLPWLALLTYAAVLVPFLDVYAGGSDSAGYLGSARLLRHFQITTTLPQPADLSHSGLDPTGFVPRGFALTAQPGIIVPTYPVGLPLLFGLALSGLPEVLAIPAVILFHLLAGLVLTYLLGRLCNLSKPWAFGAAAAVALCPLYLFMGLQPMSDVPALVWVTGAIVLALAVRKNPDRLPSAIFCGVATAVAVLIRPADAIALPAIALALPWRARVLLRWIVGGLPFAVAQTVYNQHLYGHPFLTGYGSAGGLFSAAWLAPTLLHYAVWLPALLTPALGALLIFPFLRSVPAPRRWLFVIWIGTFGVFYATYSCTHESWWYLRFLLPVVPACAVGSALVFQRRVDLASPGRTGCGFATALGLAVAGWMLAADQRLGVLESARGNRVYRDSAVWLEQHAPANAIVVCSYTSGALNYYSHLAFFQPSNAVEAAQITAAATAARRPLFAEFFSFDQQPLPWFTHGHWSQIHRAGDLLIWRWDPA